MILRQAILDDAAAITALTRAAYVHYIPLIGREPKPMRVDYSRALQTNLFWLLEQEQVGSLEQEQVGSLEQKQELLALLELELREDHLLIVNVAVAPKAQGLGLGKRMLDLAESEAQRLGRLELRLYTNRLFTKNLAIYARRGYVETHRQKLSESNTEVVHMKKTLSL